MIVLILVVAVCLLWLTASVLGWVLSFIASVMFAVLVIGIAVLIHQWAFKQQRKSGDWQA